MIIIKTKEFKKDYKKIIIDKHLKKEQERIDSIENLILSESNFKNLMLNPYHIIYNIEKNKEI